MIAVRRFPLTALLWFIILPGALHASDAPPAVSLTGIWCFRADSLDAGVAGRWFAGFSGDTILLPGSMAERGKGEDIGTNTGWTGHIVDSAWFTESRFARYRRPGKVKVPFWLNPLKHYVGAAWYQRTVAIPPDWRGKRIVLTLERCHWETSLWVDTVYVGTRNSLSTPHSYDLTQYLLSRTHDHSPRIRRLTLRMDNRLEKISVGASAHSVSDHTQTNWNGIVGTMELRSGPPVWIDDLQIFPDVRRRGFRVRVTMRNVTGLPWSGKLVVDSRRSGVSGSAQLLPMSRPVQLENDSSTVECFYLPGKAVRLWDEFQPNVYDLTAALLPVSGPGDESRKTVMCGLREFRVEGTQLTINGRPLFLRGTLEAAIFPKTGYPPTDVASWRRIFRICREYGLNHMRFHSWCPPEAAFAAADEAGFYLQVEVCMWTRVGDGKPLDRWLYDESERIMRAYGNHPSFCMMAAGNEPAGENKDRWLGGFVSYWKQKDGRRLYTAAAAWPQIPENDYHNLYGPRIQSWGAGLESIINKDSPGTMFDFRAQTGSFTVPVVSHEVGQWCAYPNFGEIGKYTGVLRAGNFEIFQESLEANHLGSLAHRFLISSGRLQTLCYKADIEAALRTPGLAGFQLLDLHDFPGQGTAPVGVLDAFWETKGYVTPGEYREFCDVTVPLARMPKLILTTAETLNAAIEVAHFGPRILPRVVPQWHIEDAAGRPVQSGNLRRTDIPIGNGTALGSIGIALQTFPAPARYTLRVGVDRWRNGWNFWVYPHVLPGVRESTVLIARRFERSVGDQLQRGGKVLLVPEKGSVRPEYGGDIAVGFSSIFWNTSWTRGQPPHTLGILCDPGHPAFADFPTEGYSNWQWWEILKDAQAMRVESIDTLLVPIMRLIDDWNTNRSLALAFEVRAGAGSLLVISADILSGAGERPAARQLLHSLLRYMESDRFRPSHQASPAGIRALFTDNGTR
jgi:hypothetical protein